MATLRTSPRIEVPLVFIGNNDDYLGLGFLIIPYFLETHSSYSYVSNTRGGSNRRVDWNFSFNLVSGWALKTAGMMEKKSFV
jgi:hypothetical protein